MPSQLAIALVLSLTTMLWSGCTFGCPRSPQQLIAQSDHNELLSRAIHEHGRYYK